MGNPCMRSVAVLLAVILTVSGCASRNLTGAARVHQQVTLSISDACVIANQAEAAYEAKTIPNTDSARKIINDAGLACEDVKTAFKQALDAETAYNAAQAAQVTECSTQGPACQSATQASTSAKTKLDSANSDLNTKMDSMVSKANAAKAITPK